MTSQVSATATAPRERVATLDILRGAALFGILVMNMPAFSWTHWFDKRGEEIWPAWWNVSELWVARWFFSGKFNSLFSFLFGLGFTLQLTRLARGGASVVPTYLRKMGALLLFGLVHALLIWRGDILLTYVEVGLLLLLLRRVSDRTVLLLAFAALLVGPITSSIEVAVTTPAAFLAEEQKDATLQKLADAAYAHGTYAEACLARLRHLWHYYRDPWNLAWHGQMLGTALFGAFAGRRGYLVAPQKHRAFFARAFGVSLGLGIVGIVAWSILRGMWKPHELTFVGALLGAVYSLQRPAIMLAYVSGFMLLVVAGRVPQRFGLLAYAGRMPLTNYLAQSLICTTIFYAHGFGLYNKVGPALGFGLAVVIYGTQLVWSRFWLQRFAFGPVEWLWRTMTYGRPPRATAVNSTAGERGDVASASVA